MAIPRDVIYSLTSYHPQGPYRLIRKGKAGTYLGYAPLMIQDGVPRNVWVLLGCESH